MTGGLPSLAQAACPTRHLAPGPRPWPREIRAPMWETKPAPGSARHGCGEPGVSFPGGWGAAGGSARETRTGCPTPAEEHCVQMWKPGSPRGGGSTAQQRRWLITELWGHGSARLLHLPPCGRGHALWRPQCSRLRPSDGKAAPPPGGGGPGAQGASRWTKARGAAVSSPALTSAHTLRHARTHAHGCAHTFPSMLTHSCVHMHVLTFLRTLTHTCECELT